MKDELIFLELEEDVQDGPYYGPEREISLELDLLGQVDNCEARYSGLGVGYLICGVSISVVLAGFALLYQASADRNPGEGWK
jgi:hypothetical protein